MKKVVSLLLAVVLVCSMATVALAGNELGYGYVCKVCGGGTSNVDDYNDHIYNGGCGTCAYCGLGFSAADLENHEKNKCPDFEGTCDYCGKTDADVTDHGTKAEFDAHVTACKSKYFNIPLAKIIAVVKNLIGKIDFGSIVGTVKDKVVPAITGLLGNINLG